MAQTRDIGQFYWHGIKYSVKPKELKEPAETQEIDPPFRFGKGYAFRLPFSRRGLVIGRWRETGFNEHEALTFAVNGRGLTKDEIDLDYIRYGAKDDSDKVQKA
jgi:hypothetical protein